jgi:hypothetical protein
MVKLEHIKALGFEAIPRKLYVGALLQGKLLNLYVCIVKGIRRNFSGRPLMLSHYYFNALCP